MSGHKHAPTPIYNRRTGRDVSSTNVKAPPVDFFSYQATKLGLPPKQVNADIVEWFDPCTIVTEVPDAERDAFMQAYVKACGGTEE